MGTHGIEIEIDGETVRLPRAKALKLLEEQRRPERAVEPEVETAAEPDPAPAPPVAPPQARLSDPEE